MTTLMFVCTANQCRSVAAAALAERQLHRRRIDAEVRSAGLLESGAPASRGIARAAGKVGIDLSSHRSTALDAGLLADVDLVLTMERAHVAFIAEIAPSRLEHSFTLPEIVHLSERVGPRAPDVEVDEWVLTMNELRGLAALSVDTRDDVRDPTGGTLRAHRRLLDELSHLETALFDRIWPDTAA